MTARVGDIKRGIEWIRTRAWDVRHDKNVDALPDLNALADFAQQQLVTLGVIPRNEVASHYIDAQLKMWDEIVKLRDILTSIQSQTAAPNILQLTQDGLAIIRGAKR